MINQSPPQLLSRKGIYSTTGCMYMFVLVEDPSSVVPPLILATNKSIQKVTVKRNVLKYCTRYPRENLV